MALSIGTNKEEIRDESVKMLRKLIVDILEGRAVLNNMRLHTDSNPYLDLNPYDMTKLRPSIGPRGRVVTTYEIEVIENIK